MDVRVHSDSWASGTAAARFVGDEVRAIVARQGFARVIFATGASQFNFLNALVALGGNIPWDRVDAFHLDEYVDMAPTHPASFRGYLEARLFSKLSPPVRSKHLLDPARVEAYAGALSEAPIDLACIGIGENGHIAFNDPPVADFDDPELVKIVALDDACRRQQVGEGWFASLADAPTHAATLTIPAICRARVVSVVCPDARKAAAVAGAVDGPVGTDCPATALRDHARCVVWCDADSASRLAAPPPPPPAAAVPGFVDLQVNGYRGVDFSAADLTAEGARHALRGILSDGGCAACLATLITAPAAVYEKNLPLLAAACGDPEFAGRLLGIHMEGPFVSGAAGAVGCHPPQHTRDGDVAAFLKWHKLAGGFLRLVTVAADRPGVIPVVEAATAKGVAVSLGHQLADDAQMKAAADAGATLATHVGNGCPNAIHRHANAIWPVLADDRLAAMVIADGRHLPPPALVAMCRCKTWERVILTSDLSPAAGLADGAHAFGETRVVVRGDSIRAADAPCLAGSGAPLLACANGLLAAFDAYPANARPSRADVEAAAFHNPLAAIGAAAADVRARVPTPLVRWDGRRFHLA